MRGCVQKFEHRSEERIVNRNLLYISTIILTLAGCASEDYIGDPETRIQNENGKAISLNLTAAPQTRSAKTGAEAAGDLNNNFVIWGDKTVGSSTQTVFNNYQANYVTGSENTTTSNSAGWEYIGYKNLPYGTGTRSGDSEPYTITLNNDGVATNATATGVEQSIKFWDYSASNYNFFAYSLGKGDDPDHPDDTEYAKASAMTTSGYSLSGTADQLKACYISNKKTISPSASSSSQVQLEFMNFASNVKMAFYETVPGYSVKDIVFYAGVSTKPNAAPYPPYLYLYSSDASDPLLPTAGTYTVSFDTNGKAQVSAPTSATTVANLAFGDALTYTADKEHQEAAGLNYIGRSSDAATPTTTVTVLPNPGGTDLHLKIDYTLLTRDGLGETIKVTGATATVPAVYAQWKPNHSYTYLFKISDNTNGLTNPEVATKIGLSPITLDAVVCAGADGEQETVTTVTDPSITTYQKGSDYATTDTYNAGDIYVVVTTSTGTVATLTTTATDPDDINAKLYTVTNEKGSSTSVTPAQQITETSVANVLTTELVSGSYAVTDANGWTMTVTPVAANVLSAITQIDANDAPDGKAITINGAKFTAAAGTTYVFEYIHTTTDETPVTTKLYKVIKVASGS